MKIVTFYFGDQIKTNPVEHKFLWWTWTSYTYEWKYKSVQEILNAATRWLEEHNAIPLTVKNTCWGGSVIDYDTSYYHQQGKLEIIYTD